MVMDLKKLADLIQEEIIEKVDHKHLNLDVDFFKGVIRRQRTWLSRSGRSSNQDQGRETLFDQGVRER